VETNLCLNPRLREEAKEGKVKNKRQKRAEKVGNTLNAAENISFDTKVSCEFIFGTKVSCE